MADFSNGGTASAVESGSRPSLVEQAIRVVGVTETVAPPSEAAPAPDGYVRITPVQKIRVPEGYTRRVILRVSAVILGAAAVIAALYALLRFLF